MRSTYSIYIILNKIICILNVAYGAFYSNNKINTGLQRARKSREKIN